MRRELTTVVKSAEEAMGRVLDGSLDSAGGFAVGVNGHAIVRAIEADTRERLADHMLGRIGHDDSDMVRARRNG